MNKEEINHNLNTSTIIRGAGIGTCFWSILNIAPFLITHPNMDNILAILFSALFGAFFYEKLKEQNQKNKEIIKEYKIKNYNTPAHLAACSGLIGSGTLTFLQSSISNPNKMNIGLFLMSAAFLTPQIIWLLKTIKHNKQQIDKVR